MTFHNDVEIEEYLQKKRIQKLIDEGRLCRVQSYEQYCALVKEAKSQAAHKLFTNCYLMKADIQRLMDLKSFYQIKSNNGLVFVGDEHSHYRAFLYIDLEKQFWIPRLDRSVLVETVYWEHRVPERLKSFEMRLEKANFCFYKKYQQIDCIAHLEPEKFWKQYAIIDKFLKNDGKHICIPDDKQLQQFDEIYREEIDIYTQVYFTEDERRKQRDQGYLLCVSDSQGEVYSISVSARVFGGATAVKQAYVSNMYAAAVMFGSSKPFYENMPDDPEQLEEYMRPKAFGWIATKNTASRRAHDSLGIRNTGKAMNQYILAGYAY